MRNFAASLKPGSAEDLLSSKHITVTCWKRRFWGGRVLELIGWMARRWL
jgi:hypothetical protein